MSSIQYGTRTIKSQKPPFTFERLGGPRDINIDVSNVPAVSTHPWYDSAAGRYRIPAGRVMAKITASGLYVPCKRSKLAANANSGQANATLEDASSFKIGDTISIDSGGGDDKVIGSINYTTNVVTVTVNFANNHVTGDEVYDDTTLPGAQTAVGLLEEERDYTESWDIAGTVLEWARINEAALTETITTQMKTDMPHIQWV